MAAHVRNSKTDKQALGAAPASWSWFANGPLKGCALLRERQRVLAWDEGNAIYTLDLYGELLAQFQAPKEIVAVAGADTGVAVVAVGRSGDLWWLDADLQLRFEMNCNLDALATAVDPFGYYAVVSGRQGKILIVGCDGKRGAEFEIQPPLRHLAFVPGEGDVLGAAEHGLVTLFDLKGRTYWSTPHWSNVGGLAVDGQGEVILLACFGRGIARFGGDGGKEGAYRMEVSPSLVAVDFEGRRILAASLEQTLTELSYEGTIRASEPLPDKPVGLAMDALGRYAVIGFHQGEVKFLAIDAFFKSGSGTAAPGSRRLPRSAAAAPAEVIEPAWEIRAAQTNEEVDSAVLEVVPGTDHLAVYTNRRTLRIFDGQGELHYESAGIAGVGRSLRAARNWLIAASDSNLVAYDPHQNVAVAGSLSLYEISHLEPCEGFGNLILIQSCEYVSRATLPETEHWKQHLDYKVESAAALPDGRLALALDDKNLRILTPLGKPIGRYKSQPAEPLLVSAANDGWVTLARDARVLRGHEADGKELWTIELPWAPWSVRTLGRRILATSIDGASLLATAGGKIIAENREPRQQALYFISSGGEVCRAYQVEQTLLVAEFGGRLLWRYTAEARLGPFAAGAAGIWAFLGRTLAFFPLSHKETR